MPFFGTDLSFSVTGDYELGDAGDLHDTFDADREAGQASVRQFILHRLATENNGWQQHPELCAALEQFIGRTVNPSVMKQLELRIKQVLTFDGYLPADGTSVKAIDIGAGSEAVMVLIYVANLSNKPIITFAYDFQRGGFTQIRG